MGKKIAKYPALGALRSFPLYPLSPKRREKETEEAFKLRVEAHEIVSHIELVVLMVDRDVVVDWALRFDLFYAEESKRLLELERSGAALPSLYTIEGTKALRDLQFEIVSNGLNAVSGIQVGDIDLELVADPLERAQLLDHCGHLAQAAGVVRDAQSPSPTQSEH